MSLWVRVCKAVECPPGTALELVAENQILALFNINGQFFALDGICPHQGGPLGKGKICGQLVTCPWHGWQFDVRSGQHQTNSSIVHPHFDARVEDGEVFVLLPPEDAGD